jgi:hypothetical protein
VKRAPVERPTPTSGRRLLRHRRAVGGERRRHVARTCWPNCGTARQQVAREARKAEAARAADERRWPAERPPGADDGSATRSETSTSPERARRDAADRMVKPSPTPRPRPSDAGTDQQRPDRDDRERPDQVDAAAVPSDRQASEAHVDVPARPSTDPRHQQAAAVAAEAGRVGPATIGRRTAAGRRRQGTAGRGREGTPTARRSRSTRPATVGGGRIVMRRRSGLPRRRPPRRSRLHGTRTNPTRTPTRTPTTRLAREGHRRRGLRRRGRPRRTTCAPTRTRTTRTRTTRTPTTRTRTGRTTCAPTRLGRQALRQGLGRQGLRRGREFRQGLAGRARLRREAISVIDPTGTRAVAPTATSSPSR